MTRSLGREPEALCPSMGAWISRLGLTRYLEGHTLPLFRIPSFMVRICYIEYQVPKKGVGYEPLGIVYVYIQGMCCCCILLVIQNLNPLSNTVCGSEMTQDHHPADLGLPGLLFRQTPNFPAVP